MHHVLDRLQRLWYLILFLATVCLITDITLSSTNAPYMSLYPLFPIPLIADIPTILIFAYALWGKSQPFLLPTSSVNSNPCTRMIRHLGTCLLACLWIMNTIIYASSGILVREILAGVAALEAGLVVVEMVGSHRVGREQRRVLKSERDRVKAVSGEEEEGKKAGLKKKKNINASKEGLLENGGEEEDGGGRSRQEVVEIVRPEAIDPSMVIYSQQMMFERYQRQYFQQYQMYLLHQQHQPPSPQQEGTGLQPLEGKFDEQDVFQESSFKIEITEEAVGSAPSSSSSTAIDSDPKHLPSAPQLPEPIYPNEKRPFVPSVLLPPPELDQKYDNRVSISKEGLSSIELSVLADAGPLSEKDYDLAQINASAPPYEPRQEITKTNTTARLSADEISPASSADEPSESSSTPFDTHPSSSLSTIAESTAQIRSSSPFSPPSRPISVMGTLPAIPNQLRVLATAASSDPSLDRPLLLASIEMNVQQEDRTEEYLSVEYTSCLRKSSKAK